MPSCISCTGDIYCMSTAYHKVYFNFSFIVQISGIVLQLWLFSSFSHFFTFYKVEAI